MGRNAYYTLIASLPGLPPRFEVERCPITRPRLLERLKMLQPEDSVVLEQLLDFLAWDRQPVDRSDDEVQRRYEALMQTIRDPLVRILVRTSMDIRTIICGLRRRRAGLPPPSAAGELVGAVQRNWDHPDFKLRSRFPWIEELARRLDSGQPREAQRLVFSVIWDFWTRRAGRYHFSFEAVICYLIRWSIINQWTSQSLSVGRERFEQLTTEIVSDHADIHS